VDPLGVVVVDVLGEQPPEAPFAQDGHVIEQLAAATLSRLAGPALRWRVGGPGEGTKTEL
jgi:hypothetical protein